MLIFMGQDREFTLEGYCVSYSHVFIWQSKEKWPVPLTTKLGIVCFKTSGSTLEKFINIEDSYIDI